MPLTKPKIVYNTFSLWEGLYAGVATEASPSFLRELRAPRLAYLNGEY